MLRGGAALIVRMRLQSLRTDIESKTTGHRDVLGGRRIIKKQYPITSYNDIVVQDIT